MAENKDATTTDLNNDAGDDFTSASQQTNVVSSLLRGKAMKGRGAASSDGVDLDAGDDRKEVVDDAPSLPEEIETQHTDSNSDKEEEEDNGSQGSHSPLSPSLLNTYTSLSSQFDAKQDGNHNLQQQALTNNKPVTATHRQTLNADLSGFQLLFNLADLVPANSHTDENITMVAGFRSGY